MYYLAHTLYLSRNEVRPLYVVEVSQDAVVRCFPFENELQSIRLVDKLILSDRELPGIVHSMDDVLPDTSPQLSDSILYEVKPISNPNVSSILQSEVVNDDAFLLIPLSGKLRL